MTKYRIVPVEPAEEQWSGLARDLMMWLDMGDKTPQGLFKHLKMLGVEPPKWLLDEAEMQGSGVPSKGTRATLIYKAMLAAAPSPWISVEERLPEIPGEYLIWCNGHAQVSEWVHGETEGWVFWYCDPTHWMPLPEAPEKSE